MNPPPSSNDRLPSNAGLKLWLLTAVLALAVLAGLELLWRSQGFVPSVTDEPALWETPEYSAAGEPLTTPGGTNIPGVYVWIAGESRVVTGIRRHLVREAGLDRSQVAFMGYWRRGAVMG